MIPRPTDLDTPDPDISCTPADERLVADVLLHVGVPTHVLGYRFLHQAVLLATSHPDSIRCVSQNLYPIIAAQSGSTVSRVERAIRHAITLSWNRSGYEALNLLLGYSCFTPADKPSNCEFISLLAESIRRRSKMYRDCTFEN